ncbi:MAG: hypothetical protein U0359_00785 [Byssovorax sp.]
MHSIVAVRPLLLALALTATLAAAPACTRSASPSAASIEQTPEAITEENDSGSITWSIGADGQVRALAKSTDGKPITSNVSGQMTFRSSSGDQQAPLTLDEKSGLLVASGPALTDDLTPVDYTITVDGKPWTGTLHLPRGGTKALADDGKEAAAAAIPDGKLGVNGAGPNGGVVQVVGKDRLEIVADKASGQVRVYVLDADLKVVPVGERKIRLATYGEASEIVVLEPEPGGRFCTGRFVSKVDPVRVTVAVTLKEETHACIVGWAPGVHLVVGSRAPRVKILVATGWVVPGVDVKVRGPAAGVVVIHDHDDDDAKVDVKIKGGHGHGHGHGHGEAKVSVKIH